MAKQNDLFLNQLTNPQFTAFDFKQVGLDVENTSLEDKDTYKNLEFVQNHPLLQTNNAFDESKFDMLYNYSKSNYNQMANNQVSEEIGQNSNFYRNNIYAPREQRNNNNIEYSINRVSNPGRKQVGLVFIDEIKDNPLSLREIAQTQKVWDDKTKSWQDSPNDSWFSNWGHTRVLAQWDSDGEHVDPVTGETVFHKKGDKKINDNGTYYYENLNGRSVAGREVLSKFDTLTVDGSTLNKFDIFDSDDKEKSIFGNVVKNALKIVPALIPSPIQPWYLGTRVMINAAGLFGTLGNMLSGNNSDVFHSLDAFEKSMTFSTSDKSRGGIAGTIDTSQGKMWSLENMINMGADVFTQLAEQRWLFKYPPAVLKGKVGLSQKNQEEYYKKIIQDREKLIKDSLIKNSPAQTMEDVGALFGSAQTLNALYAEEQLAKYMKNYNEIGKYISMAYMTGITAKDSYNEALEEGASPLEAALLTLGYSVGEYAIINSDLGKWILPELKDESLRFKQIGKRLTEMGLNKDNIPSHDKVKLIDWAKRVMHVGQQEALWNYELAKGSESVMKTTAKALFANAMGEAVEETSEELLYDISKTLANFGYELAGSDTKLSTFDNGDLNALFSRYMLSAVGGFIGGGLGDIKLQYDQANQIKTMSDQEAFNSLINIVKENKQQDFLNVIDKTTWASRYTSFDVDENGNYSVVSKDSENSQNKVVKDILHKEVDLISQILHTEGATFTNKSLIEQLSGIDNPEMAFRANALMRSKIAQKFISDYNSNLSNLVKSAITLRGIDKTIIDSSDKSKEQNITENAVENDRIKIQEELKNAQLILESYKDGTKQKEFIKKTLFEVTAPLINSFKNLTRVSYLENKYGKPIAELNPEELKQGSKEWEDRMNWEGADLVERAYDVFENANILASPYLTQYSQTYFDPNSTLDVIGRILSVSQNLILSINDENQALDLIKKSYNQAELTFDNDPKARLIFAISKYLNIPEIKLRFEEIKEKINNPQIEYSREQYTTDLEQLFIDTISDSKIFNNLIDLIKNADFISPGTRLFFDTVLDQITDLSEIYLENADELELILNQLNDALESNIKYSPITELINQFNLSINKNSLKIEEIIKIIENQLSSLGSRNTTEEFKFEFDNIEEYINTTIDSIKLLKGLVSAAIIDNSTFGNEFGYNKTLNELNVLKDDNRISNLINGKLAEIDSNTGNIILQELSQYETQLNYYQTIANVCSGNKLKEYSKTGAKSQVYFFRKFFNRFINVPNYPPSEWNTSDLKILEKDDEFTHLKELMESDDLNSQLTLTDEQLLNIEKDWKLLQETIHKFFLTNKELLNDPEKLAKLLNVDNSSIHLLDTSILNKESTDISDSAFVWHLASLAAVNPSDFMKNYGLILDSNDENNLIAPIPGQKLATQIIFAAITNGKVFNQFANAFNIALLNFANQHKDNWESLLSADRREGTPLNEVFGIDSDVSIDLIRSFLVEGIAGSGKSTGTVKQIINMLRLNPEVQKKVLSNVWFVHTSLEKAEKFAKDLFGDEWEVFKDNIFSHLDLMKTITSNQWEELFDPNSGEVTIDELHLEMKEGQRPRYNYELNKSIKSPSLIITDEVSHLSLLSLQTIDEFCELSGCSHLAFGDYDLSGVRVKAKLTNDENNLLVFEAKNTNFIHSYKLGESLRTDNILKDGNNFLTRKFKLEVIKNDYQIDRSVSPLLFTYQENPSEVLLGDKLIEKDINIDDFKLQVINLLKKTKELGSNYKLGYIHNIEYDNSGNVIENEFTKIMEELNNSSEFKNMIDFKSGNTSQGDENPYYVINLSKNFQFNDKVSYKNLLSDFYTAITRAKRGSLIINTDCVKEKIRLTSKQFDLNKSTKSLITNHAKINFINKTKKLFSEVYGEGEIANIPYVPNITKKTKIITQELTLNQDNIDTPEGFPEISLIITDEVNNYSIISYNLKDGKTFVKLLNLETGNIVDIEADEIKSWNIVTNPNTPEPEEEEIKFVQESNKENLSRNNDIDNSQDDLLMLLHTFNCNETGLLYDNNGNPMLKNDKPGLIENVRRDNIVGLLKLCGATINVDENGEKIFASDAEKTFINNLINGLNTLRSAIWYKESEEDIVKMLKSIIEQNSSNNISNLEIHARLAYKIYQPKSNVFTDGNNKDSFIKSGSVQLIESDNSTKDSPLVNNTLSMIFFDSEGNILLEVPIASLTNPFTLAFSKGFDENNGLDINKLAKSIYEKYKNISGSPEENFYNAIEELKKGLTDLNICGKHSQANKLLNYINLWQNQSSFKKIHGGEIIFLTKSDKTPLILGKDLGLSGLILTSEENISSLSQTQVNYTGDWISYNNLKKRRNVILSEKVYVAKKEYTIKKSINGENFEIKIKPGHAFIIASDNLVEHSNLSDLKLFEELINEKSKGITIIYVEPQTVNLTKYINFLNDKCIGKDSKERIGSYVTSYRMISDLLKTDEGKEFILRRLNEIYKGLTENKLNDAKISDEVLKYLINLCSKLDEIKDSDKLIEELKKSIKDDIENNISDKIIVNTLFKPASTSSYSVYFNRMVRLLALGENYDLRKKISYKTIQESKNIIDELNNLISNSTGRYDRGIFISPKYGGNDEFALKSGNEAIAFLTDTNASDIKVNGKFSTNAFKLKGENSKPFFDQISKLFLFNDDNVDTQRYTLYNGRSLSELIEKPKEQIKKIDLINNFLNLFNINENALNYLLNELKKLKVDDLKKLTKIELENIIKKINDKLQKSKKDFDLILNINDNFFSLKDVFKDNINNISDEFYNNIEELNHEDNLIIIKLKSNEEYIINYSSDDKLTVVRKQNPVITETDSEFNETNFNELKELFNEESDFYDILNSLGIDLDENYISIFSEGNNLNDVLENLNNATKSEFADPDTLIISEKVKDENRAKELLQDLINLIFNQSSDKNSNSCIPF